MTRAKLAQVLQGAKLTWSNGNVNLQLYTDKKTAYDVLQTAGVGSVREHRSKYRWSVSSAVDIDAILRATNSTWTQDLELLEEKLATSRAGYRLPRTSLAPRIQKTLDPDELAWAKQLIWKQIKSIERNQADDDEYVAPPKIATDARIKFQHVMSNLERLRKLFGGTAIKDKGDFVTGTWTINRKAEVTRVRELLEV
ncbi:MAG: hypothetical protein H0T57_11595 [Rubrobacter sp.]|nr:hypothetical protein [Rubrobacter sp.]